MYCLDTNIIIDIWRGDSALKNRISSIGKKDLFITSITLCELFKGAFLSANTSKDISLINALLDAVSIADFTPNACRFFGAEFSRLKRAKIPLAESDLMIASIAKAKGLILITRDKKDFSNINLDFEVW
ncbi:MAG: type II toxin-antitoxin system VapC family toxin [Nanoarchaeota archaeon]